MKNNAIIKEMKKQDKNIFRALNQCYGFDFEKPFTTAKINGSFTINKVLKEIEKKHNPHNSTIVILTVGWQGMRWRSDKLLAVQITGTGAADFEIEHHMKWFNFSTRFDSVYTKGDFNAARKNAEKCYIIAQDNENIGRKWEKKNPDLSSRFFKSEKSYGKYIKDRFTKIEYDMTGINFRCNTKCSIDDFMDKSGYIVEYKRQDLARRAEQLRKERQAAAFRITDNTAIIKGLQDQLSAIKAAIVEQLSTATTSEGIREVEKSLSWYKGLGDAFSKFEYIKKNDEEKKFSSVGHFNDNVNELNKLLQTLREGAA